MLHLLSLTGDPFRAVDLKAEGGLKLVKSLRALTMLRSLRLESTAFLFSRPSDGGMQRLIRARMDKISWLPCTPAHVHGRTLLADLLCRTWAGVLQATWGWNACEGKSLHDCSHKYLCMAGDLGSVSVGPCH